MTFKATKTIAKGNGMIPVVRGSANYSRFAPPHSYINVRVRICPAPTLLLQRQGKSEDYVIRIPLWRNFKQGVSDPSKFHPDLDPTDREKPDPDPTLEKKTGSVMSFCNPLMHGRFSDP